MVENIPEGYKKTEVGLIPEEWKCVKLGLYSEITKLAGFEYSKYFNSYNDGGEVVVLRGTNITNNKLNLSDVKYIPLPTSNFLKRSQLSKNDLVFAYVGTIGPVYLITESNKYHLGPNTARITVNNEVVPRYAFLYFTSKLMKKEIDYHISVGAQPSLSMTKIRKFNIVLPPKSEQQAIATALSDIDGLVSSLTDLINKKKNIKQGVMQELLTGKKRLDGFSGGWMKKRIDEIAKIISGGTPSTSNPKFWNGYIKWCTPTDITNCKTKYLDHTEKQITQDGLKNSSATLLPKGALLFCSRATIGEVRIASDTICTNQGFKSLVVNEDNNNEWLYYWILNHKTVFIQNAIGSTFLEISKKDMQKITVLVPTKEEQNAIATVLSNMDSEIEVLKKKLNKYKEIKQGMMQELLTGKRRLI